MPNWCFNELKVTGPAKDIEDFRRRAATKESAFSFEPFLPMPEELTTLKQGFIKIKGRKFERWYTKPDGTDVGLTKRDLAKLKEKLGYTGWYDRNIYVLGTKWDVKGRLVGSSKTFLVFQFDSAWSPPEAGVIAISEMYPELEFRLEYDEPAMNFGGYVVVKNGETLEGDHHDSPMND